MSRLHRATSSDKDVVARINRFSQLRSVERAVRPSVRRRISLAGAGRRQGLLQRLQRLLEAVLIAQASGRGLESAAAEIESVDAELDGLSLALSRVVRATPLAQFRSTLPEVVATHRGDAVALLDFWLDNMDWRNEPIHLVEYLITLLATDVVGGRTTLVRDPASVSVGVDRACARHADARGEPSDDALVKAAAERLRETSICVLVQEDLEETIVAMREVKERARACFFDRELLRSVVQYNATVKNRFAVLASDHPGRGGLVDRTLAALRALDASEPLEAAVG